MDLDLVIVGGGPAGVATALFLAEAAPRLKDRIAILEKERYPREKICGGAIGRRADRLLESIGVRVDVPGVPVSGISVATSRGTLATRDPGRVFGRVVRRIEFDRALADEARARGIRIVEGARVTGIDVGSDGVRVSSTTGDVRARAIVGADGVGSFVRRTLGLPRGRWRAQVVEVDTEATPADLPRDLIHFDVTDGRFQGYGWDFPTVVGGRELVCRGFYELARDPDLRATPDAADAPDIGARLVARLRALGVGEGAKLKRFSERGLALHEPTARPRVLLAGESAGIDPVLGEGIAQAITYGATAGRYLAERLDRGDLSFVDWPRVLKRSRVGLDLRIREHALWWIYGPPRQGIERFLATSRNIALAGLSYFGGEHVSRRELAAASIDFAAAFAREAISSRPWEPSS